MSSEQSRVSKQSVRVVAAHVSPVFMDTAATVDKACHLIDEAGANGGNVMVFPETYIPVFPLWSALAAPIYNHHFFTQLAREAVHVPGPEVARIAQAAKRNHMVVSMGINEGTSASSGCMWNSNLIFGPDGSILNHHRKLVPTFYEKLTWAAGDGAGLRVCDTEFGRIGALICGENTNPLARYTMMAQGEQIHLACFPPVWPTHDGQVNDGGSNYELADAIRVRTAAHSVEAKCFTVVASAYLDDATIDALRSCGPDAERILTESPRGVSMVINPQGQIVGNTQQDDEGLLYADINLDDCVELKQIHDISGGYNRFDVFTLKVNRRANRPIQFDDDELRSPRYSRMQHDAEMDSDGGDE